MEKKIFGHITRLISDPPQPNYQMYEIHFQEIKIKFHTVPTSFLPSIIVHQ